jgi:hypothetical protein
VNCHLAKPTGFCSKPLGCDDFFRRNPSCPIQSVQNYSSPSLAKNQIEATKSQLEAKEERLKLANDKEKALTEKVAAAEAQIEKLTATIAGSTNAAAGSTITIDKLLEIKDLVSGTATAIGQISAANNELRSSLSIPTAPTLMPSKSTYEPGKFIIYPSNDWPPKK